MITEDTLRFSNPVGDAYIHTLTKSNRLNYLFSTTKGQIDTRVFTPIWRLVEAEAPQVKELKPDRAQFYGLPMEWALMQKVRPSENPDNLGKLNPYRTRISPKAIVFHT